MADETERESEGGGEMRDEGNLKKTGGGFQDLLVGKAIDFPWEGRREEGGDKREGTKGDGDKWPAGVVLFYADLPLSVKPPVEVLVNLVVSVNPVVPSVSMSEVQGMSCDVGILEENVTVLVLRMNRQIVFFFFAGELLFIVRELGLLLSSSSVVIHELEEEVCN
ncbi:hypothetical protein KFK09_015186 [Dendrobium nobile]|uniref:Uncharacterized protein n=1 Tax=Dendrobium nobile TaxID=94219 RepID=A0A8T3B9T5_DENNO|nr:hypothetical protein KFK09_015186 [Dendrobium nobile]